MVLSPQKPQHTAFSHQSIKKIILILLLVFRLWLELLLPLLAQLREALAQVVVSIGGALGPYVLLVAPVATLLSQFAQARRQLGVFLVLCMCMYVYMCINTYVCWCGWALFVASVVVSTHECTCTHACVQNVLVR